MAAPCGEEPTTSNCFINMAKANNYYFGTDVEGVMSTDADGKIVGYTYLQIPKFVKVTTA